MYSRYCCLPENCQRIGLVDVNGVTLMQDDSYNCKTYFRPTSRKKTCEARHAAKVGTGRASCYGCAPYCVSVLAHCAHSPHTVVASV